MSQAEVKKVTIMQRFSVGFADWSNKYIPNSLVFVFVLSWIAALASFGLTKSGLWDIVVAWEKGFWALLSFAMQMSLAMITGFVVADSPFVKKRLIKLASLPNNATQAVLLLTGLGCVVFWFHWAVGLMGITLLGREMLCAAKRKGYKLHVPLVASGTYACFLVCNGPSFPAALYVAAKGHFMESTIGVIPVSQTIFHPINFLQMGVLALLLMFFTYKFIPPVEDTVEASDDFLNRISGSQTHDKGKDPKDMTPAERLNANRFMGASIGIVGCMWFLWSLFTKGFGILTLDFVNFTFLMLGFVLHGSAEHFMGSVNRAISTVSGVIVQFPLYAGIFGMIKFTGLAEVLVEFFVSISTTKTFPMLAFFYSGFLNMFVPSSGSKFIIEAPYILPAALKLGVDPAIIVNAYTVGDCTTNLIQPFWALPVLGLFEVEFKDILPFGFAVCLAAMLVNAFFFLYIW